VDRVQISSISRRTQIQTLKIGAMKRTEAYSDFLLEQGYRPSVDEDGDVTFKYEGGFYYLSVSEDDDLFFQLVYARFWNLEDEDERLRGINAANEINMRFKVVKVYIRNDDTSATIECFMHHPNDFQSYFERSLRALQRAVYEFRDLMLTGHEAKN
jgi:hypothetical protein